MLCCRGRVEDVCEAILQMYHYAMSMSGTTLFCTVSVGRWPCFGGATLATVLYTRHLQHHTACCVAFRVCQPFAIVRFSFVFVAFCLSPIIRCKYALQRPLRLQQLHKQRLGLVVANVALSPQYNAARRVVHTVLLGWASVARACTSSAVAAMQRRSLHVGLLRRACHATTAARRAGMCIQHVLQHIHHGKLQGGALAPGLALGPAARGSGHAAAPPL